MPPGRRVFPSLTVRENLTLAARGPRGAGEPWTLDRVYHLFPILRERERSGGTQLSGGQQQMLAFGSKVMTNPALLGDTDRAAGGRN